MGHVLKQKMADEMGVGCRILIFGGGKVIEEEGRPGLLK